jgi:uncharacterized protein YeaO (DUF488 family)
MVRIARIYDPPGTNAGWRVLVDRLWPRGVRKETAKLDVWLKEIGPSDALRHWFGHKTERWPEFQKRYRAELAKKADLIEKLRKAEKEHGTVTLLFGAKDQERNQAVVLRDVLRKKS